MPELKIFPSLLSADFGKLQQEINAFEPLADGFHFDVMDGHFVPNLSMGAPVLARLKTEHVFDVHLMVSNPADRIPEFSKAGAHMVCFHWEATQESSADVIAQIHKEGMQAGITIKPKTPLEKILPYIEQLDYVLIMSVEPGYSGQSFMPEVLTKVETLRQKFPDLNIEIDGGISDTTVVQAKKAGANMLVSASYLFGAADREQAVEILRK